MLGDVCAIVMGGHSSPPLAVLIVIIFLIEQSVHVATQINETAAAYQVKYFRTKNCTKWLFYASLF